jgi:hypothetical protein
MLNHFHRLLASSTEKSLLTNLNLPTEEETSLVEAAKEIRGVIIAGFNTIREDAKRLNLDLEIQKPKFAVQGSYIYGTLNAPAYPPDQQVDIDLGMYLPFSVLGYGQQPKLAVSYYFSEVTRILSEHIAKSDKGWMLPPLDKQRDTCIRVILNQITHIDIPLYAVPEGEFHRVSEDKLAICKQANDSAASISEEFDLESLQVEAVNPNVIHMAHRKNGWQPSDALVIRDWVKSNFRQKGRMIRPVNRFLKAWRDIQWPEGGGPSSIFLLAHSLKTFPENADGLNHCQVLYAVVDKLPYAFDQPLLVPCPTSDDKYAMEDLRNRIKEDELHLFKAKFRDFRDQYYRAKQENPDAANDVLITLFGKRMPKDPSRVVVSSDRVTTKTQEITSAKPDVLPLYTTDRSTSG